MKVLFFERCSKRGMLKTERLQYELCMKEDVVAFIFQSIMYRASNGNHKSGFLYTHTHSFHHYIMSGIIFSNQNSTIIP